MYLDKFSFLASNKAVASKLLENLQEDLASTESELSSTAVAAIYDDKYKEQAIHLDGKRMYLAELITVIQKSIEGKK